MGLLITTDLSIMMCETSRHHVDIRCFHRPHPSFPRVYTRDSSPYPATPSSFWSRIAAFRILPWWWFRRCWPLFTRIEPVLDERTTPSPLGFLQYLSFRSLLDIFIIVISASARTSTSVSGFSTTSRSTTRLVVVVVVTLSRRRAHKGKVDRDGLVEQLCVVYSFDGSLCLVQCGEFDQDVAL